MALNDLPIIDRASLNSDESAIQLEQFLNRSTGFLLREDVPDLGCDFDVEVIREGTNASGWRFALQLKSVEKISTIADAAFISYSFKTSRLGYLLRRLPAYGLIVLYDVNTKRLYYDYADEIYSRLMQKRESDDWTTNDQVNILIPIDNVLTVGQVKDLHQKFTHRFEQGALMQRSQGAKYGLPAISLEAKKGFDFNDLEDVKMAVRKWGMSLLIQFDLKILYQLIAKLPSAEIQRDKELCFIALITYSEAGRHADSIFLIERIRKRFTLSHFEQGSVDFIELKNKLYLGGISPREYVAATKKLLPSVEDCNSLTLRVNLLYFELSLLKNLEPIPEKLGQEIQQIFLDIEDAEIDELQKQYLKLWNADALSRWIGHFRRLGFTEMSVRENMKIPIPLNERIQKAERLLRIHDNFYFVLDEIEKFAKAKDHQFLWAQTVKMLIKFELSFEIDQIANDSPKVAENDPKIADRMGHAEIAYNIFVSSNLYHDAYEVLLLQMDLYYVGISRYAYKDHDDIHTLEKIKLDMEKEFEFDGELSIPNLLKRTADDKGKVPENMMFLKDMNEGQLDTLAEILMQSKKFPRARKANIIAQMKSYQLFYERCTNKTVEVQEVSMSDQMMYIEPVSFVLKNRDTGIVSLPSKDMEHLLASWGF